VTLRTGRAYYQSVADSTKFYYNQSIAVPNPISTRNPIPSPVPIPNPNPNLTVNLTLSLSNVTTIALKLQTCKPTANTQ